MSFLYILFCVNFSLLLFTFFIDNYIHLTFTLLALFFFVSLIIFYFSGFIGLLVLLIYSGGLSVFFLFVCFSVRLQTTKSQGFTASPQKGKVLVAFVMLVLKAFSSASIPCISFYTLPTELDLYRYTYEESLFATLLYTNHYELVFHLALLLLVAVVGALGAFWRQH